MGVQVRAGAGRCRCRQTAGKLLANCWHTRRRHLQLAGSGSISSRPIRLLITRSSLASPASPVSPSSLTFCLPLPRPPVKCQLRDCFKHAHESTDWWWQMRTAVRMLVARAELGNADQGTQERGARQDLPPAQHHRILRPSVFCIHFPRLQESSPAPRSSRVGENVQRTNGRTCMDVYMYIMYMCTAWEHKRASHNTRNRRNGIRQRHMARGGESHAATHLATSDTPSCRTTDTELLMWHARAVRDYRMEHRDDRRRTTTHDARRTTTADKCAAGACH